MGIGEGRLFLLEVCVVSSYQPLSHIMYTVTESCVGLQAVHQPGTVKPACMVKPQLGNDHLNKGGLGLQEQVSLWIKHEQPLYT